MWLIFQYPNTHAHSRARRLCGQLFLQRKREKKGEGRRKKKKEEEGRRKKKKEGEGRRKKKKKKEGERRRKKKKEEEEGRRRKKEEEEGRRRKKEEVAIIKSVGEERRIKHYSSRHRILLVGEGDFSFSACLAVAFGSSATNIIATSLDSVAFLKKNYGRAMSNIEELRSGGSKAMHEIDATEIANHELLRRLQFDRIIFNFPFAGFFPDLSPECQLRCHRSLVSLFLENAKDLLSENGEIHVSHKTNGRYHAEFKLENIAASHGLRLIAAVEFKCSDYPSYNTKYGFGGDKNFNCYPSNTFKFGLN